MDTPRNMYQWHYTLRHNTLQYTLHTQPADVNQLDSVQLWSTCFGIIVVSPRFGAICTIAVGRLGDETAEMKLWRWLVAAARDCFNCGDELHHFSAAISSRHCIAATAEMESGVLPPRCVSTTRWCFQLRPTMSTERSSARAEWFVGRNPFWRPSIGRAEPGAWHAPHWPTNGP